jgi:hypothetical protein
MGAWKEENSEETAGRRRSKKTEEGRGYISYVGKKMEWLP